MKLSIFDKIYQMEKKPTVFISSTIFDFKDLRSALKYHLEKLDYNVQLSEFNDFVVDLDSNSYETCIKNIESCDYFILLIGSRVGGMYDKANNVSITQNEYRKAYELLKENKVKLVCFVREEIWNLREDRKALVEYLKKDYKEKYELNDEDIMGIAQHRSNFVNDAEFIFNFINEVTKVEEFKSAETKEELPKGNWVFQFVNFEDVISALTVQLRIKTNLTFALQKRLLYGELFTNLKLFYTKTEGTIHAKYIFGGDLELVEFDKTSSKFKLKRESLKKFCYYAALGVNFSNLITHEYIDICLNEGVFVKFNSNNQEFELTAFQKNLLKLKNYIISLQALQEKILTPIEIKRFVDTYKLYTGEEKIEIDLIELLPLYSAYFTYRNIEILLIELLRSISIDKYDDLKIRLFPTTPFEEEMVKNDLNDEEILGFLDLSISPPSAF